MLKLVFIEKKTKMRIKMILTFVEKIIFKETIAVLTLTGLQDHERII